MCSGRVDLDFVLRAFLGGQDGVFIGGCRLGECNYITHGNYHALNMVALCKGIMRHIGINPERLNIEFMSSGDGILLADNINKFTGHIKNLGPAEQAPEIKSKLEYIIRLVPYIKIKCRSKLSQRIQKIQENELFTKEEINRLFDEVPNYHIDPDKCKGCTICKARCPVDAIAGTKKQAHSINQDICIKCGTCIEVCPSKFNAIRKFPDEAVKQFISDNYQK